MWLVGNWGQKDPWTRSSGVQMVMGEDGLYTGVLTLPKGTKFDLKILKNPTAGKLIWSATRYTSVLNSDDVYDFGEFTENLIPNGNFEEGDVKWTPTGLIYKDSSAHGGQNVLVLSNDGSSASSDTFVISPNQVFACSFYFLSWDNPIGSRIIVKNVDTQSVLFEYSNMGKVTGRWGSFSGKFKSGNSPVMAQVICEAKNGQFDDISLVST